jgi:hypothetical protein
MLVIPTPAYSLAKAAWIPRITIWRDDDTFDRRDGETCERWLRRCGQVGGLRLRSR